MKQFIPSRSIEFIDNRISRFIAQYGKCAVIGIELGLDDWYCHDKTTYYLTKDDSYRNLTILNESVHRLIHKRNQEKIQVLLNALKLNKKQLEKVHELSEQCLNGVI
ncbi:hypothetical protein [Bacillus benzoevorans]|uniref:PhoPQ-activated pathogenicity-related protein n=1 Tax=Bacillus benzoevorans TaxID=1456 RepID=A0A7X0HW04_9BACI|nr:hypothetical protein [Bacillus benzoevorans]MBB6447915.1 PhoPQ-activated pathogenicity-related protein [Bacillus benzoevorans]